MANMVLRLKPLWTLEQMDLHFRIKLVFLMGNDLFFLPMSVLCKYLHQCLFERKHSEILREVEL